MRDVKYNGAWYPEGTKVCLEAAEVSRRKSFWLGFRWGVFAMAAMALLITAVGEARAGAGSQSIALLEENNMLMRLTLCSRAPEGFRTGGTATAWVPVIDRLLGCSEWWEDVMSEIEAEKRDALAERTAESRKKGCAFVRRIFPGAKHLDNCKEIGE